MTIFLINGEVGKVRRGKGVVHV